MTIPPLVWKLLPWGAAIGALALAVQMYGAKMEARGEVKAYVETADRLQAELVADSVAGTKKLQVQADSIASLNRTIARAGAQQVAAKAEADSMVGALAATLDATQRVQLAAITAAHERERAAWGVKEMAYTARLRLKDDSLGVVVGENVKLRAINASLRAATESASPGHGASFIQRASPYIAAAAIGVYAVDKLIP
jgi:hypothetical protein